MATMFSSDKLQAAAIEFRMVRRFSSSLLAKFCCSVNWSLCQVFSQQLRTLIFNFLIQVGNLFFFKEIITFLPYNEVRAGSSTPFHFLAGTGTLFQI
jgi:hypothetical protein